jgi:hypothetical protein
VAEVREQRGEEEGDVRTRSSDAGVEAARTLPSLLACSGHARCRSKRAGDARAGNASAGMPEAQACQWSNGNGNGNGSTGASAAVRK